MMENEGKTCHVSVMVVPGATSLDNAIPENYVGSKESEWG